MGIILFGELLSKQEVCSGVTAVNQLWIQIENDCVYFA